jgi:hypothetical protein
VCGLWDVRAMAAHVRGMAEAQASFRQFARDTWMHRLDISRATGRLMELTAGHDGRLVAGVVTDWARRHSQPFTRTLTGTAGGPTFGAARSRDRSPLADRAC